MDKKSLEALFDRKLSPIDKKISDIGKSLNDVNEAIQFVSDKYEEMAQKMKESETQRSQIIKENAQLKIDLNNANKQIGILQDMVNDQEQYGRRDCLEIRGIPSIQSEQTDEIVLKVSEAIGIKLQNEDISISNRLPMMNHTKPNTRSRATTAPPIIVKFTRRSIRDEIYSNRKQLRNLTTNHLGYSSANKIYIVESLTRQNKLLFNKCLEVKKNHNFKYIWTRNGNVLLRKDDDSTPVHISNLSDFKIKLGSYH